MDLDAAEILEAGYSLNDVKAAGFSAADAKKAGFTIHQTKAARYLPYECKVAGFTFEEATRAGFVTWGRERRDFWFSTGMYKNGGLDEIGRHFQW